MADDEFDRRIRALEARFDEMLAQKPIERLATVEQVRAQWQASIPRLLDKLKDLKKIEALEARIGALEEAAARNAGSGLT